ncbi:uncharacterized protein BX663DRAFT_503652 [Cokeromyces recurvatus]|uniref:uncharacterized protein n=1 Tax=Cokeromyces recurvatus TaxID=90255 RepID=UPI00221E73FA|nr:uncharacterized protein BX663DRAFT_503652 [Cokeromyces recurvatus]KAI7904810.1 hypothetical protein BX663DRAFT_503652 [Cokeromyces recurvatus]
MSINDSLYEFDAPQFWDLTDSITQTKPNASWFHEENISGPSFPEEIKRRPLRSYRSANYNFRDKYQKREQERIQQISNNFLKQFEEEEEETTAQKIVRHESSLDMQGKRQVLGESNEGMLTRDLTDPSHENISSEKTKEKSIPLHHNKDDKENVFDQQAIEQNDKDDTISIYDNEVQLNNSKILSQQGSTISGKEFFERLLEASKVNLRANIVSIQRLLPKNIKKEIPINEKQRHITATNNNQQVQKSLTGLKRHFSFDADLSKDHVNIPQSTTTTTTESRTAKTVSVAKKFRTNTPERSHTYQPDENVERLRLLLKSPNEKFS